MSAAKNYVFALQKGLAMNLICPYNLAHNFTVY